MEPQVFAPLFSGVEPDRNPVAAHQIYLVAVLGICVSQRIERGVRNHPEPCRIRISNYFCVGTYKLHYIKSLETLTTFIHFSFSSPLPQSVCAWMREGRGLGGPRSGPADFRASAAR